MCWWRRRREKRLRVLGNRGFFLGFSELSLLGFNDHGTLAVVDGDLGWGEYLKVLWMSSANIGIYRIFQLQADVHFLLTCRGKWHVSMWETYFFYFLLLIWGIFWWNCYTIYIFLNSLTWGLCNKVPTKVFKVLDINLKNCIS